MLYEVITGPITEVAFCFSTAYRIARLSWPFLVCGGEPAEDCFFARRILRRAVRRMAADACARFLKFERCAAFMTFRESKRLRTLNISFRITSYNVCYTKLLRSFVSYFYSFRIIFSKKLQLQFVSLELSPSRITSYNVCYTKLLRYFRITLLPNYNKILFNGNRYIFSFSM